VAGKHEKGEPVDKGSKWIGSLRNVKVLFKAWREMTSTTREEI
jgi:hypothetical protein